MLFVVDTHNDDVKNEIWRVGYCVDFSGNHCKNFKIIESKELFKLFVCLLRIELKTDVSI